jgi:hypothetical protein
VPRQLQQIDFILIVEPAISMIDNLKHPHRLASLVQQGNGEQGICAVTTAGIDSSIDFIARIGTIPSPRLQTLQDRACDPFVIGYSERLAFDSQSWMTHQLASRFIPQKDTRAIAFEHSGGGLCDILQESIQVLVGVPIGCDVEDLIEPNNLARSLLLSMPYVDGPRDGIAIEIELFTMLDSNRRMQTENKIPMGFTGKRMVGPNAGLDAGSRIQRVAGQVPVGRLWR